MKENNEEIPRNKGMWVKRKMLTSKHKMFIDLFFEFGSARRAAVEAGFSASYAKELLHNELIKYEINKRHEKKIEFDTTTVYNLYNELEELKKAEGCTPKTKFEIIKEQINLIKEVKPSKKKDESISVSFTDKETSEKMTGKKVEEEVKEVEQDDTTLENFIFDQDSEPSEE